MFLYVPSEDAKWYEKDDVLSSPAKTAFPNAAKELREAGNCLAFNVWDSAVFHSMRAVEHGLRAVAKVLNVKFPFPIELADWQNVIDQIESAIRAIQAKSVPAVDKAKKDAEVQFYSEAASHFMYFKDAWRKHVAHTRTGYKEPQATKVVEHVAYFIERISERVAEQP
jgi:hypothetical protein